MPRAARRRASATAAASAPRSSAESRGTSSARTSVQQHSIRRTSRTPATTTTPSSRDASAARPETMVRGPRTTTKPAVASPATPAVHAHDPAFPWSHSATATAAAQPAIRI